MSDLSQFEGFRLVSKLTLLWPGFHFPPEAASPTVTGEDKQVDIAAIAVPEATANVGEGGMEGGAEGERVRERKAKLKLTDRNH